ncbi:MAG: cellulase family glycosylhydrolase [Chloroflexi bacterium]|nr:cellulase family glycosylhydrolase [Chloroflexota bacterium]
MPPPSHRPRHTFRNVLLIATLALLFVCAGSLVLNRAAISGYLGGVTGEDEFSKQARAFPEYLSGIARQQPRTDDFVPIAHNGVNPFGVNTFLNQEVEPQKRARQLDLIRDAGFKWIRQEFPWEDIEIHGKGDFDDRRNPPAVVSAWDKYDGIVRMAAERGIGVIARLSTPPRWTRSDPNAIATTPPDNLNDYGDFVAAVVSRYRGQIRYYQIWNEPNVYPEWGDRAVSPEGYVDLLKAGYTRAKQADPEAVIIAAPLAPTIELGPRDMNDFVFLQRMYDAGAKDFFDILSVNDYGLWSGPSDRRMRPRVLNFARPLYVRDIMVRNGDAGKAIWASEIGWNAIPEGHPAAPAFGRVSDDDLARYMPAAYQRAQAEWPWMGVMSYWFFKRASDAERDQSFYYFRMLEPDFTALPVYAAMQAYTRQKPIIYPGYFQEDHWAISASDGWQTVKDARAVLGAYRQSSTPNDSLTFTFQGSGLDVVFVRRPGAGVARVNVDGQPVEFNLVASDTRFGERTSIARGLPGGPHTARIEVVSGSVGVDGILVLR